MGRVAADGLALIFEKDNSMSIIEINSETDFVAKNNDFKIFVKKYQNLILKQIKYSKLKI